MSNEILGNLSRQLKERFDSWLEATPSLRDRLSEAVITAEARAGDEHVWWQLATGTFEVHSSPPNEPGLPILLTVSDDDARALAQGLEWIADEELDTPGGMDIQWNKSWQTKLVARPVRVRVAITHVPDHGKATLLLCLGSFGQQDHDDIVVQVRYEDVEDLLLGDIRPQQLLGRVKIEGDPAAVFRELRSPDA